MEGKLQEVPKSQVWKDIVIDKSQWFNVSENQVYKCLNYCFENQQIIKSKGKELMDENREKFTLKNMTVKLDDLMNKYLSDIPTQVEMKLPKLKKITDDNTEPPKMKLPKLKKVTSEVDV